MSFSDTQKHFDTTTENKLSYEEMRILRPIQAMQFVMFQTDAVWDVRILSDSKNYVRKPLGHGVTQIVPKPKFTVEIFEE